MTVPSAIEPCLRCGRRNRVPASAAGTPRCGECHTPLPWQADATDADFADVAESSSVPVLLDLWAPWCGPCRTVSPALEGLARAFAGKIKLVKVNVDAAPELARRFGVQAIPTLVVLRDGKPVARQTGAAPPPALRTWLEQALESNTTSARAAPG